MDLTEFQDFLKIQNFLQYVKHSGLSFAEVLEAIAEYKVKKSDDEQLKKRVEENTQMVMGFVHKSLGL